MNRPNQFDAIRFDRKPFGVRTWAGCGLLGGVLLAVGSTLGCADRSSTVEPTGDESASSQALPELVGSEWLAERLGRSDLNLKILDSRSASEYVAGHIPGSLQLSTGEFRGKVDGVASMLLSGDLLAEKLSALGIEPDDTIVLVPNANIADATMLGMGLNRVGHRRWAILDGGFDAWTLDAGRPVDDVTPSVTASDYPAPASPDDFTIDFQTVLARVDDGRTMLIDTRPPGAFRGGAAGWSKTGHIPGAVNRPIAQDTIDGRLRPVAELAAAYGDIIPSKDSPVVVYCRTGREASQSYFILTRLLDYTNVLWYDGSWTEWATQPEAPVATGS